MFRRSQQALAEPLPSVAAVNDLVASLSQHETELSRFRTGVSETSALIEQLAKEEQEHRDAMYRHAAKACVQPEEQALAEKSHEQARACGERRADLTRKLRALEEEVRQSACTIETVHRDLERARQKAWEGILESLLDKCTQTQRDLLLSIWTALDQRYNGAPPLAVFQRLGLAELSTEIKLRTLETLCAEYGLPNRW